MEKRRKIAAITGGSSGIGFAFAEKLTAEGYDVILIARNEKRLSESAAKLGNRAKILSVDVSDTEAFVKAAGSLPNLDMLVHSAGILNFSDLTDTPVQAAEKLRKCIDVNLFGTVNVIMTLAPKMNRRGKIGVISSVAGLAVFPGGYASYGTSKAAEKMWCEEIRPEIEARGITLTMIYPSVIRTPMTEKAGDLPPVCRISKLREPSEAVETFLRDMSLKRKESYCSLAERLEAIAGRIFPFAFSKIIARIVERM